MKDSSPHNGKDTDVVNSKCQFLCLFRRKKSKKKELQTAALDETRFLVGSAKVVNFSPQRGSLLVGATPLGQTLEAEAAVKNIDSNRTPVGRKQNSWDCWGLWLRHGGLNIS